MSTVAQDRPTGERIGLPPFPAGWYRVASSDEVARGAMISMRWLGQEMICWRSESDGAVQVMDAFCAHLGAHVGRGGFIKDDTVVCPFHHWRYDRTGQNVEIPYRDKPQRKARLAAWPTLEINGQILVWNGPAGVEPDWAPPVLAESTDPAFVRVEAEKVWKIRTHVQEVLENTVDVSHFQFVHGVAGFGSVELVQDGPMFRAIASVTMDTPRGQVDGAVESELWGLGLDIVRQVGIGRGRSIFSVTPIDDEFLEARHTFFVERDPESGEPTRYGKGFMREFGRQIVQDIPIWESKLYRSTPKLVMGENAIVDYRRWAGQFYPTLDDDQ